MSKQTRTRMDEPRDAVRRWQETCAQASSHRQLRTLQADYALAIRTKEAENALFFETIFLLSPAGDGSFLLAMVGGS
jgi:hypothetical protein